MERIDAIHTYFWNGAKLTDRLSYNNDDINYFGTEALDYLESDDPIYDHYYMKTARKNISVWTVYIFLSRFASPI